VKRKVSLWSELLSFLYLHPTECSQRRNVSILFIHACVHMGGSRRGAQGARAWATPLWQLTMLLQTSQSAGEWGGGKLPVCDVSPFGVTLPRLRRLTQVQGAPPKTIFWIRPCVCITAYVCACILKHVDTISWKVFDRFALN